MWKLTGRSAGLAGAVTVKAVTRRVEVTGRRRACAAFWRRFCIAALVLAAGRGGSLIVSRHLGSQLHTRDVNRKRAQSPNPVILDDLQGYLEEKKVILVISNRTCNNNKRLLRVDKTWERILCCYGWVHKNNKKHHLRSTAGRPVTMETEIYCT